jgi:hypothetical protein
MDAFLSAFFQDPMRYIAYGFAFFSAVGIVLFLRGFGSGMPHLFTYSEDAEHMEHARARAVWGVLVCMVVWGLWEVVRVVVGQAPPSYLILSLLLLTPLWIPWLKKAASGGGGH